MSVNVVEIRAASDPTFPRCRPPQANPGALSSHEPRFPGYPLAAVSSGQDLDLVCEISHADSPSAGRNRPPESRSQVAENHQRPVYRLTSTEVVGIRGARRRAGATATSLAQARRRLAGEVAIGPLG